MIGTPHTRWREMHQSGREAIMFEMRSSPQAGIQRDLLDGIERGAAQIVALHADEPLLGGAEDGRVVAAPAVRIAVRDLFVRRSSAPWALQNVDDDRVGFPDGLADDLFGQAAGRAFGVIEAAGGIDRTDRWRCRTGGRRRSLPGRGRARCGRRRCLVRA